jgi:glucose-6-phosphate-specific signal transduction histidine kinase
LSYPRRSFQVIVNNSIQHSRWKDLSISTRLEGEDLVLMFKDDGIGILDKGKPFQQGNTRSGFGLSLSKEILSITGIETREIGSPDSGHAANSCSIPVCTRSTDPSTH